MKPEKGSSVANHQLIEDLVLQEGVLDRPREPKPAKQWSRTKKVLVVFSVLVLVPLISYVIWEFIKMAWTGSQVAFFVLIVIVGWVVIMVKGLRKK